MTLKYCALNCVTFQGKQLEKLGVLTRDLCVLTHDLCVLTRDLCVLTRDPCVLTPDLCVLTCDLCVLAGSTAVGTCTAASRRGSCSESERRTTETCTGPRSVGAQRSPGGGSGGVTGGSHKTLGTPDDGFLSIYLSLSLCLSISPSLALFHPPSFLL